MDNGQPSRRMVLGGTAAMMAGGNPPQRPDQQLQAVTRPGSGPAAASPVVIARVVLVQGAGGGVFVYDTTGALADSMAFTANVDPLTHSNLRGVVNYNRGLFAQLLNGALTLGSNAAGSLVNVPASIVMADTSLASVPGVLQLTSPTTGAAHSLFYMGSQSSDLSKNSLNQSVANQTLITSVLIAAVTNAMLEVQGGTGQAVSQFIADASTTQAINVRVTGDTFNRLVIAATGQHQWGSGSAGFDATLQRLAANQLGVTLADFAVHTVGRGLQVAEGSNAKQGRTAAMTAGTITVANTSVTAASEIICTGQVLGGTAGGVNISARTAGTSFTITSTSATDTSTVGFQMFEPG